VSSGLQFIFHNLYITLRFTVYISQLIHYARLTVYISQLMHYAQAYSKLQAWTWCMSCDIWTVSLSVMYELGNINCKSERNVWVVKYKLQAWAWCSITLRLTVYISQLIHHAQAYSLYFTTHTLRSGLQFIFHNSYITLRLTVCISQLI
jgi:hypothetical protein